MFQKQGAVPPAVNHRATLAKNAQGYRYGETHGKARPSHCGRPSARFW